MNIFNVDETAALWNQMPQKTYVVVDVAPCLAKRSKERLTVVPCVNGKRCHLEIQQDRLDDNIHFQRVLDQVSNYNIYEFLCVYKRIWLGCSAETRFLPDLIGTYWFFLIMLLRTKCLATLLYEAMQLQTCERSQAFRSILISPECFATWWFA